MTVPWWATPGGDFNTLKKSKIMRKAKYFIKQLVAEFVGLNEDLGWEIAHDLMDSSNTADELKANILDAAMDYCSQEDAVALCDELFDGISVEDLEAWLQDRELSDLVAVAHKPVRQIA